MDLNMVQYLAKLSKLSFSDEELKSMADDMTSIIEIMDTIKEMDIKYDAMKNQNVYINDLRPEIKDDYPSFPVDVESVKKEYRNAFLNELREDVKKEYRNAFLNELREDVNKESFPTEKILQNATNSNDCFVVPKVVE